MRQCGKGVSNKLADVPLSMFNSWRYPKNDNPDVYLSMGNGEAVLQHWWGMLPPL
jgi:hypothetical protein